MLPGGENRRFTEEGLTQRNTTTKFRPLYKKKTGRNKLARGKIVKRTADCGGRESSIVKLRGKRGSITKKEKKDSRREG